ncbi:nuclear pore complex protein Nup85-like [Halichondria panicea]|uniref:nuclear pore complex protein Nup85-like n=1 Tax=Halichondria panicea TaxID=6063 RepID=UPI00312B6787
MDATSEHSVLEQPEANLAVPVTLSAVGEGTCRLKSRWMGGRGLAVYSQWNVDPRSKANPQSRGREAHHMTDESQVGVYEIQWESSKWNRATRKFANQTHGYFMSIQKASRRAEGVEPGDLVRCSQLYRSALHECVLSLRKMAAEDDGDHGYSDQVTLYSLLELVWHLCEVLFIEVLPVGCLVQQLIEWVRWHSGGTEDELMSSILTSPSPGDHDDYWHALYRLVLKGRLSEARDLLSHHPITHLMPQVHASMDELLRKAPMILSTGSYSRAELQRRWNEWRGEVVRRRGAGEFTAHAELELLAAILSGDDEVFENYTVAGCCDHWYELMVAKLLYTLPLVTSTDYDLIYVAESALRMCSQTKRRGAVDDVIMAALRNDVMELIKLSSSHFSSWWMVSHLSNLLNHRGLLVASKLEYGSQLSEFFLLEYASSLASHTSLWQVAMGYLSECPQQGRAYMEAYIERVPVDSERKVVKVLRVCEKYQLKEKAQSVCRVQAMRAYQNGRLGVALSWCIRGKDSSFAAFLAEKYMDNYKIEGEFMDLDLLDHLGDAMLLNERLMFLAKYREYHQLYESGKFVSAGKLLVTLLLSNTVPTRFWTTLLTDALLLMEYDDEIVFGSEQTYALSHLVQQLTLSSDKSSQSDPIPKPVTTETFSLLNLALSRNLSRAILEENSI